MIVKDVTIIVYTKQYYVQYKELKDHCRVLDDCKIWGAANDQELDNFRSIFVVSRLS